MSNQESVITVYSVLANRRRQYVILYMLTPDQDEWTSMADVARRVTAVKHGYSIQEAKGEDYLNVRESLRHTHFDALADAGVIEYDAQQTHVTPGERLAVVGRILGPFPPAVRTRQVREPLTGAL